MNYNKQLKLKPALSFHPNMIFMMKISKITFQFIKKKKQNSLSLSPRLICIAKVVYTTKIVNSFILNIL